jgi:hypothetical protein
MLNKLFSYVDSILLEPVEDYLDDHKTLEFYFQKTCMIIFVLVALRILFGIARRFCRFMPNL